MEDEQPVVCVDLHRAMSIEPGAMCIEPGAVSIEPARMSERFCFLEIGIGGRRAGRRTCRMMTKENST